MKANFRNNDVMLALKPGWLARSLSTNETLIVRVEESAIAPSQVTRSVLIRLTITPLPAEDFARALMRRRVPNGDLSGRRKDIGGAVAWCYSWTDGILDIESCFVARRPGRVAEVSFAAEPTLVEGRFKSNEHVMDLFDDVIHIEWVDAGG